MRAAERPTDSWTDVPPPFQGNILEAWRDDPEHHQSSKNCKAGQDVKQLSEAMVEWERKTISGHLLYS